MKLGLENIRKLLAALGDPHEEYLKVQIAGTNGKGSVCAFLNSICLRAGIRTGMYTSPHLVSITERVKIEGVDIRENEFARFATRVRDTSETLFADGAIENIPTFFEQVTAIALLAFAEAKIELAILETGLGGRLDATTAANAEIAAITRIDLDHQQYLGETIEEIAAEKAAIIHKGSRVVVGEQLPDAMEVIFERCRSAGVAPVLVATGGNSRASEFGPSDPAPIPTLALGSQPLGLAGRHQIENARIAVAIAEVLREHFTILDEDIATGLKKARHPGRLERIGQFLLDGSHNVGGARALRAYIEEFVHRPITLVFGAMNDKDVREVASVLFPKAGRVILTTPNNSRAIRADDLLQFVPDGFDRNRVCVVPNAVAAIERAREISGKQDTILVTGSLYLVGEVRGMLTAEPPEKLKTDNGKLKTEEDS